MWTPRQSGSEWNGTKDPANKFRPIPQPTHQLRHLVTLCRRHLSAVVEPQDEIFGDFLRRGRATWIRGFLQGVFLLVYEKALSVLHAVDAFGSSSGPACISVYVPLFILVKFNESLLACVCSNPHTLDHDFREEGLKEHYVISSIYYKDRQISSLAGIPR